MSKDDGMRIGGALGALNELLDDVFGVVAAGILEMAIEPVATRAAAEAASRQAPTPAAPRASYQAKGSSTAAGQPQTA